MREFLASALVARRSGPFENLSGFADRFEGRELDTR